MIRLFFIYFFLFTSVGISIAQKEIYNRQGKDHAIFFAVDDYENDYWDDLRNPISDAVAIATELRKSYGFDTIIYRNPTQELLDIELEQLAKKEFKEDEQLFLFFTGHGLYKSSPNNDKQGEGFFIPRDGKKNKRRSFLAYSDLIPQINKFFKCKHILLVIDACYSGAIFKHRGRPGELDEQEKTVIRAIEEKSRLGISSGNKNQRTLDGEKYSPLSLGFLKALNSGARESKVIDFFKLVSLIKDQYSSVIGGAIDKEVIGGDFVFIPKGIKFNSKVFEYLNPEGRGSILNGNSLVDKRNNRAYNTILINGKRWMSKNLNYSTKNNSWCYASQDGNCGQYGRLYNWYAAKDACEGLGNGWRLPTDLEWQGLINTKGLNKLHLTTGGTRYEDGVFNNLDNVGYYWSTTSMNSIYAKYFYLSRVEFNEDASLFEGHKDRAYSCRCIRDEN